MIHAEEPFELHPTRLGTYGQGVILHENLATIVPRELAAPHPVATFNWPTDDPSRDAVMPDESVGLLALSARLRQLGHRHVGLVIEPGAGHGRSLQHRRTILRQAFAEGFQEIPALSVELRRVMTLKGDRPGAPTALIAYSGREELPMICAIAAETGVRIPQDLSVACADRTPWCRVAWRDCACIWIPVPDMCDAVTKLIQRRIANPRVPISTILVPTVFSPGMTCGPVAGARG